MDNLRLLRGRWGPYLTDGEKNARLPKDREPETITLDEARELIANAPLPKRRWGRPAVKKKVAKKAARKRTTKPADAAETGGNGAAAPGTPKPKAKTKASAKPRKKAAKTKPAADDGADPAAG